MYSQTFFIECLDFTSLKSLIKTGVLSLKIVLSVAKINPSIVRNEILQGRRVAILTVFSVMKFLEHTIAYHKLSTVTLIKSMM